MNILDWLKGKKTYFIGFALLVHAVVINGWQNGDWSETTIQEIFAALALWGIRAGITKSNPNL